MSDVVREVVAEVLGWRTDGGGTGAAHLDAEGKDSAGQPLSGGEKGQEGKGGFVSAAGIRRPHYQRERKDRRLAPLFFRPGVQAGLHGDQAGVLPAGRENRISEVFARCLGAARDGTRFWFFPSPHPELSAFSDFPLLEGRGIGVVEGGPSRPSHLFLVEEVASQAGGVDWQAEWDVRGTGPFRIIWRGNPEAVYQALRELRLQLNRRAYTGVAVHLCPLPSPQTAQFLDVEEGEAVAAVEGLSGLDGLGLLDRLLHKRNNLEVRARLGPAWILLYGALETVEQVAYELRHDADLCLSGLERRGSR